MSDISQLASRVGGDRGGVWKILPISLHYTWLRERGRQGGSVPSPCPGVNCFKNWQESDLAGQIEDFPDFDSPAEGEPGIWAGECLPLNIAAGRSRIRGAR
jgi:hypothetical protein